MVRMDGGESLKWSLEHEIESPEQFLVHKLREEFHLFRTVFADVYDQIFYHLFREIHVAVQIAKRHFRLNHPELAGVPRSVRVFGTECRPKGVNSRQR